MSRYSDVSQNRSVSPFGYQLVPDDVVRQLRHLPSAPRVLPKLKKLLSDGNSAMHEVVLMIRLDPGIAARVLQMGNSAYYSHGLRCYTVDEAVNRVGYDQIYELVAHAVASQVLVRPLIAYGIEADQLWRMSVTCALAAEIFADQLRIDRDVAYTVGLLHGVGMVAIDEWAFRQQLGLCFTARALPLETCEAERATLGFHNAEAGAALLRLWEFPAVMSEPVRWQYLPRGTTAHFQLAAVLYLAKWLRSAVCEENIELAPPDPALLRSAHTSMAQLERLIGQVRTRLADVSSLLDVGTVEHAKLVFPNGERAIDGHRVTRNFINQYA